MERKSWWVRKSESLLGLTRRLCRWCDEIPSLRSPIRNSVEGSVSWRRPRRFRLQMGRFCFFRSRRVVTLAPLINRLDLWNGVQSLAHLQCDQTPGAAGEYRLQPTIRSCLSREEALPLCTIPRPTNSRLCPEFNSNSRL